MSINKKEFITQYILSLKERTRNERNSIVFGFDWVIYQILSQKGETPIRLPFIRSDKVEKFKTKTEPEFGIDLSFLNKERKLLTIFVLKDEPLQYKSWVENGFYDDLRRAAQPDLTGLDIKEVKIILAYNKDEDKNGLKCFEDFKKTYNSKIYDNIILTFNRWNLSRIVEEVESNLLTVELVPQQLSGILSYLCSQINDFDYMSEEWQNQLVPNWKRFLSIVFKDTINEARINVISIALIILHQNKKDSLDSEAGWLDLIEWAALHLWSIYRNLKRNELKVLINNFWVIFYLRQLEEYYLRNKDIFRVENGIKTIKYKMTNLVALNDAILAYDFIGKFGIMVLGVIEYMEKEKQDSFILEKAKELNNLIQLNPATLRPLVDVHHIQLYIIWLILYYSRSDTVISKWLIELENYLLARRIGNTVPFIEGRNQLEIVVEFAVTGKKPYEYVDTASYLLMMILEISLGLKVVNGQKITERYFKHIILGYGDDNRLLTKDENPIDLQSWHPPDDWDERIFLNNVTDGTEISTGNFSINLEVLNDLDNRIKDFIEKTVTKFTNKIRKDIPLAVYLLACLKNKSPLPPYFWRRFLNNDLYKDENVKVNTSE